MMDGDGNELLTLDDAAWRLACMANIEHCNINVEFNDVRFDTICILANVIDDGILVKDLQYNTDNSAMVILDQVLIKNAKL